VADSVASSTTGDADPDGVRELEGAADGAADADGRELTEGLALGLGFLLGEGCGVGVAEAVGVGGAVAEAVGAADDDDDDEGAGAGVGAGVGVGTAEARAVKVTEGAPPIPVAVALSVFDPAMGPSVQLVTATRPSGPVVISVAGFTTPPPETTTKVTPTPATGFPLASSTMTLGGTATRLPTGPDCPSPESISTAAAGPAVKVIVDSV
jgi:hypothetical protein